MSTILQIQNINTEELKRLLKETIAEELLPLKGIINNCNNSPPPNLSGKLMSMKESAHFLQITTVTLYKYVKMGEIKFYRVGKRRRFKKTDLENYLIKLKNTI